MQLVLDPGKAIGLNCLGLDGFEWRSLPNLPEHHAYVMWSIWAIAHFVGLFFWPDVLPRGAQVSVG